MVMTLVRKNKVEKSPHFEEIVERLSAGKSARSVSKWLKDEYNEDISHAALARYNKNCICMEDKVEAELNRRAEERKKKLEEEKEQARKENKIQQEADIIESAEETIKSVSETIADNMQGVAKVAAQLPNMFEKAKKDAMDPDTNVTFKDVANITLQANKIFAEYFKDTGTDVEVNVTNEVIGLSDSIEASRQKYVKWKEEQLKKKE
jgi:hypothetical protein